MILTNINGTAEHACACGSWLKHWAKFSGLSVPTFCPVAGCINRELVGAHVMLAGGSGWYIIPLCQEHNRTRGELKVSDLYPYISANKSLTCAKPARR